MVLNGAKQTASACLRDFSIETSNELSEFESLGKGPSLCEGPLIEKIRHVIVHEGRTWEVDEFLGENLGLVVAEVELTREDESFEKPSWAGREVTEDPRYYNSNLVTHPYRMWNEP